MKITILGAGAWGTALANAAERAGRTVILYTRGAETVRTLAQSRSNPKLPGVTLGANITVTGDLAQARTLVRAVDPINRTSSSSSSSPSTSIVAGTLSGGWSDANLDD